MSSLEGCIELGPVGNICFLEDGFGCLGVFLESVCLRAESEIGHDDIATSLQQAKGKGERDAAATTSDNGSLAVEVVEGHVGVIELVSKSGSYGVNCVYQN